MFKSIKGLILVVALLFILLALADGMVTYASPAYLNEKYDNGDVGVHSLLGGKITFEIKSDGTATYLDWWESTVPVYILEIKAGTETMTKIYDGAYRDDTNLYGPYNKGGQQASISHIVFYYLEEPEPTITPDPTETPVPSTTPDLTTEPTITPEPTVTPTPEPTNTPQPTMTPKPTETPHPTSTPEPTPDQTPKPGRG